MSGATRLTVGAVTYELEVAIDASPERVWEALFDDIGSWWLPDFHMLGPGSTVAFERRAGGQLLEHAEDGSSLLWCTVHMLLPGARTVYLTGGLAADWGGPAQNSMKMEVRPRGTGALLVVADALFGHIDDDHVASQQAGWGRLFREGLKAHVERRPGSAKR